MKTKSISERDIRLWDHEPLFSQRWILRLFQFEVESQVERDLKWCDANDWELVSVSLDGTREFRAHGKTFHVPDLSAA